MDKKRILIVEDNLIASLALEMMIEGAGFESAGRMVNADNLVEQLGEYRPDLILLDIMLDGEKTGIEVAKELREQFDTPIIFTTALNDLDTRKAIDEIDNASLTSKPYLEEGIIKAINQLIR